MTQAFNVFIGWFTSWGMYVYREFALCSLHSAVFEIVSFRPVMTGEHSDLRSRKVSSRFGQRVENCGRGGEEGTVSLAFKRLVGDWAPSKLRAVHTPA